MPGYSRSEQGSEAPGREAPEGRGASRGSFIQSHPLVSFPGAIAGVSAALAIPLYLVGASYLSYYFAGFGLAVSEMGFSVYDTLMARPIQDALAKVWPLAVVALGIFLLALLLSHRKVRGLRNTARGAGTLLGLALIGFLAICFVAFFVGRYLGQKHACLDTLWARSALSSISIVLLPSPTQDALWGDFSETHLLIAHQNGHYYIFPPVTCTLAGSDCSVEVESNCEGISRMVHVIPDARVDSARVQVPAEIGGGG